MKKNCPCGSGVNYSGCCGLYHNSKKQSPQSPEKLMRARYTAYTLANIDYIKRTMRSKALQGFNAVDAKKWAMSVSWVGLEIIKTTDVMLNKGYVEFIASFIENGKLHTLHEVSEFIYDGAIWLYIDGEVR